MSNGETFEFQAYFGGAFYAEVTCKWTGETAISVDWDGLFALFASKNVGGNFNWSCYANPEIDRLLAAGVAEFDQAKRKAIYLKIEQILIEQAVTVPLVDEFSVWVMRSNVKGVRYNYSAYPILSDAYMEK